MDYLEPSFGSLKTSIKDLKTMYSKGNAERLALLELVELVSERIDSVKQKPVLMGLLLVALDCVEQSSAVRAKQISFFGMKISGSHLDELLRKALGIKTRNEIPTEKKLIWLSALHQFVEAQTWPQAIPYFKDKASLLTKIINVTQPVYAESLPDIHMLLAKRPNFVSLKQKFIDVPEQYIKIKKGAAEREEFIKLIRLIEASCKKFSLDDSYFPLNSHLMPVGYALRYGLLLYIMLEIEQSYFMQFRVTRAEFYKLCQDALNVKHTSELSELQKLFYLQELATFFLTNFPEHLSVAKKLNAYTNEFFAATTPDPHPYLAKVKAWTSSTVNYGLKFAIAGVTGSVLQHSISRNVICSTTGYFVCALSGVEGAVLATQLATLLAKVILPDAMQTALMMTLSKAGQVVSDKSGEVIYLGLSLPVDAANLLMSKLNRQRVATVVPAYENPLWIAAVANLPETLVGKSVKAKLLTLEIETSASEAEENDELVTSGQLFRKSG